MATVIRRAEEHVGRRGRDRPGEGGKIVKVFKDVPLKDSLKATWERIASVSGHTLDLPSLWSLQELYRDGKKMWALGCVIHHPGYVTTSWPIHATYDQPF